MSDSSDTGGGFAPMPPEPFGGPPSVAAGPAPAPVENAVRLMFARAALTALGLIALLATKSSLRDQLRKSNADVSADRLDSLTNTAITIGIVVGIIFIVLYVLLALQVRKGKNWARIVTWVLAALGVLGALAAFRQDSPPISRVLALLGGIIDLAIIVLLAQRPSSEFFRRTP